MGSLVKWAEHGMTNYPFDLSKRPSALKIPKDGFTADGARQTVLQEQSTQEAQIRMKIWMQGALVAAAVVLLCGATAQAQTDVALSGYGTFTSSTTGSGTHQTPSNSAGGLF